MRRIACLLAAYAFGIVAAWADAPTGGDVLEHAFIPSAENVHGETRLLKRDDGACMQVILHSASFRRGIREILQREADVWQRQPPGYEDSLKYRAALEEAKDAVLAGTRAENGEGGPYTMIMEFVCRPESCRVDFFRGTVERDSDTFRIVSCEAITSLPVSDRYMSRAMLVMSAAAFGRHRADVSALLESAGWMDLAPETDPAQLLRRQ